MPSSKARAHRNRNAIAPQRGQGAGRHRRPRHGLRQTRPGFRNSLPAARFVVAYYQQVGRAGRAVDSAFGILLSGSEDDEISDYFIRTAFPPVEVMSGVLAALEKRGPLTLDEIGAELNQGRGAIEKALKLLEVDGVVTHDKHGYSRAAIRGNPT